MKPKERLLIRRPLVRAHVEEPNKQKPSELIALKAFFTFYPTDNAWRLNATITYEFEWGGATDHYLGRLGYARFTAREKLLRKIA